MFLSSATLDDTCCGNFSKFKNNYYRAQTKLLDKKNVG